MNYGIFLYSTMAAFLGKKMLQQWHNKLGTSMPIKVTADRSVQPNAVLRKGITWHKC